MNNFIQTQTGAYVSVASIEMAEEHTNDQMQIRTPVGRFIVSKTDFNKAAGITAPAKKARPKKCTGQR